MTVQTISGITNLWLPQHYAHFEGGFIPFAVDTVIDAANEEVILLGRVWLDDRTGSKTISAAGSGKIWWMPGAATITFANAGTTFRVGIQDADAANGPPGRGDGTDDVYAELTGGTDTITALTLRSTTMTSGTKTLAHGDVIAVSLKMTARGGTDLVRVRSVTNVGATVPSISPGFPLVTSNLGSYAIVNASPLIGIEFDDGSMGYIDGGFFASTGALVAATTYHSGSTPDERGNIFRLPGPVKVDGIRAKMLMNNASSDCELILYSDPLGTPAVIEAVTLDGQTIGQVNGIREFVVPLTAERTLSANTDYAVTLRPTSTNTVNIYAFNVAATAHWTAHSMGADCNAVTRTDNTGAFTEVTTSRNLISVRICGIGDDAGGGGGSGISRARAGSGMGS